MIIDRIEIYKADLLLKEPFRISLETVRTAQNLFVLILTRDGLVGSGECCPFPSINGEHQISQWNLAPRLARAWIGKTAKNIPARIDELDEILLGNNSLKSAFDMALYDLNAQFAGLPLWQFLGGQPREIITDMTVSLMSAQEMADKALTYFQHGFETIKIKLGEDSVEDIQRIEVIRQTIGDHVALRIDANQGWNENSALKVLQAIDPFHIGHCEEPLPHWNLKGQVDLTARSPIPIMADESLFDHHDAKRLLDFKACHEFNIKLGKSGGIHKALKISELAGENKIRCQVGCFMETRLAMTALTHFVYANPVVCYFDMDAPLLLGEDPIVQGIQYSDGGIIKLNTNLVGLGACVDPEYLNKCQQIIIS